MLTHHLSAGELDAGASEQISEVTTLCMKLCQQAQEEGLAASDLLLTNRAAVDASTPEGRWSVILRVRKTSFKNSWNGSKGWFYFECLRQQTDLGQKSCCRIWSWTICSATSWSTGTSST